MRTLFLYNEVESVGLQYLSTALRQAGHETALVLDPKLFNFFRHEYNSRLLRRIFSFERDVMNRVREYAPDVVGFQMLTANYEWCCKYAQQIKEMNPSTIIVAGGYHATASAKNVLETGLVDYVIRGEAEDSLVELVNSIEEGKADHSIQNLAYLDADGQCVENPLRPYEADLDRFGRADVELFRQLGPPFEVAHMSEWHRGCPWGCTFCGNNTYRKMYFGDRKDYMYTKDFLRSRTVDDVLAELSWVKKTFNPPIMRVNDDDICANQAWLEELAEKMTEKERIPFKAFAIPNNLNETTVPLLKKVGCQQIQMGVQSLNPEIRKLIGRPNSDKQIAQAIDLCKQHGIGLYVDQIFGLPGETEADCAKIESFYAEHPPDVVSIYWLDIWAGADILQQAVDAGTITQETADFISRQSGTEPEYGCISTERQWTTDFARPYARRIEIRNHFGPRTARFLIATGLWHVVDRLYLSRWIRFFNAIRYGFAPEKGFPPAKKGYDISWARFPRFVFHFMGLRIRSWFSLKTQLPLIIRPPIEATAEKDGKESAAQAHPDKEPAPAMGSLA
ncbi:MAG: radical SAM protein [Planctomycetota bacterium]|nr:radical SAM protein [Planctomycetota bacterium]